MEFKSDPNDINKETNPSHIDFIGATCQEKLDFSLTLNRQLQLRSLAITGLKQERLECLCTALEDEHTYLELCSTVKRYEDSKQYQILPVDWCVPCIMHLHNRIVEKILLILIKKGYNKQTNKEQKEAFISAIESTMKSCVLGFKYNETNWSVPLNEGKADIASAISLTNMKSKKVIALIHLLIADVFDNDIEDWELLAEKWKNVVNCFTQLDKLTNSQVQ